MLILPYTVWTLRGFIAGIPRELDEAAMIDGATRFQEQRNDFYKNGYDSLLNTDLEREGEQLARFLHLVAEHKHRIGFGGTLLLVGHRPVDPATGKPTTTVTTM